ncbi:hypothetical protein AY601_1765 [Pedobacter cryoconitis]|uniref:Uncharacterized protein n=1 Tax=Pedobacter cryoconitis TaxID=188932 RepID=A0A127VCG6_9SPHI|nr:hypothetical protein [Pedobacter cryoconitis]AMP98678.1 hypothetical protein AY601_1765 [Pedobacter cryoconitis]
MEEKLIELAITNGAFVIIVGVVLFLIKSLIKYVIDRDLSKEIEVVKKDLVQENIAYTHLLAQDLEAHKAKLDSIKQESQVQFSHLHLERAGVIRDLYAHLVELHSAMVDYTRTFHMIYSDAEKEEVARVERFNKAFDEFKNFYLPKKLYFSKESTSQLDEILEKYWSEAYDFDSNRRFLKLDRASGEGYKIHLDKINAISERVIKEFPSIISKIKDDFRKILGVKD